MLIRAVENDAERKLLSLVQSVNRQNASSWTVVAIRRDRLRIIDNDSFTLKVKPALHDANQATVFFASHTIYIAWSGMHKKIESLLHDVVASLVPGAVDKDTMRFVDPLSEGNELSLLVKKDITDRRTIMAAFSSKPSQPALSSGDRLDFVSLTLDLSEYRALLEKKRSHRHLHIMVIEGQSFLRKLLCETLGIAYHVHAAASVKDGLSLYLRAVPHIVFLDTNLPDASGHLLAHKLRELDPTSYVVMVTGTYSLEDIQTARTNGVYDFIVKPFNKSKLQEAIDRYAMFFPNFVPGRYAG